MSLVFLFVSSLRGDSLSLRPEPSHPSPPANHCLRTVPPVACFCNTFSLRIAWPVCFPGLSEEEKVVRKIRFCTEAVTSRDRFQKGVVFDDDLGDAIKWIAGHTAEEAGVFHHWCVGAHVQILQVNSHRLECLTRLETIGQHMWASGQCKEWLKGADPLAAEVCLVRRRAT